MVEPNVLSGRESEILILVAKGASNKEIARDLHISSNTVKVHMRNIFAKIDANSRTEAAMYAVNTGLVEIEGNGVASDRQPRPDDNNRLVLIAIGVFSIFLVIVMIAISMNRQAAESTLANSNPPVLDDAQRWQYKAPMTEARKDLALISYGGFIFAIGGENERNVTGTVESYDPIQDKWATLKSKPVPVSNISAAIIRGKVYVPGGITSSSEVTNVLEIYSPNDDEWERGSDLPVGLSSYGMVSYEGYLYLFGGWDGNQVVNSVFQYNPDADQWQELTAMPTARAYHGVSVIDEKIYVIGGYDGEKALSTNEVYSPDLEDGTGSPWELDQPLPTSRYAMGVASLADRIYVVGGETNQEETLEFMELSTESDNWEVFSELVDADWSHLGAVPVGTHLYLIGGELDGNLTNQNLAYQVLYTIAIPIVR
jgi:DNA-binding CsgD family transcriptional regulator/N-acetylneuraminic acid mutarotase